MTNLLNLPAGKNVPQNVNAIIEVPKNSSNKYEYDPDLGIFRLDRVLSTPAVTALFPAPSPRTATRSTSWC